jgi:hypothetical protein
MEKAKGEHFYWVYFQEYYSVSLTLQQWYTEVSLLISSEATGVRHR